MESTTFAEMLAQAPPEPPALQTGGTYVLEVTRVRTREPRVYIQALTDSGHAVEIGLGERGTQTFSRRLRVLVGTVPEEDLKDVLTGKKFRVRLQRKLYKSTYFWEIDRA